MFTLLCLSFIRPDEGCHSATISALTVLSGILWEYRVIRFGSRSGTGDGRPLGPSPRETSRGRLIRSSVTTVKAIPMAQLPQSQISHITTLGELFTDLAASGFSLAALARDRALHPLRPLPPM